MPNQTLNIIDIKQARDLVDSRLGEFLSQQSRSSLQIHEDYHKLWQTIESLLIVGGKRIRPYITLLTYQALSNNDPSEVVDIASAQELLHLALLIHDDIIDRDYIRYGIDNISGQYQNIYKSYINDAFERKHFGDSMALLAGDLLISGGYQMIANSKQGSIVKQKLTNAFGEAIFTVAGGELLDTESAFKNIPAEPLTIAKTKTAHYSFVTPLIMGAILAQADIKTTEHLRSFGYDLGIAYQLVDDLLGVFGDDVVTGKSNLSDIKEAKKTFLVECFYRLASNMQKEEFNKYFGKQELSSKDVEKVKNLLVESGAKTEVESRIDHYKELSLENLAKISINTSAQQCFKDLVNNSITRCK